MQNPAHEKILEKDYVTGEYGTFHGELLLSDDAPLGIYTITVKQADRYVATSQFQVEEYKKPEYRVTVTTGKDQYRLGDEVSVIVKSEYYFGDPVRQARVEYIVKQSIFYPWFFPGRSYEWLLSEQRGMLPWMRRDEKVVVEGKTFTDEHGNAVFSFRTSRLAGKHERGYRYSVEAREMPARKAPTSLLNPRASPSAASRTAQATAKRTRSSWDFARRFNSPGSP